MGIKGLSTALKKMAPAAMKSVSPTEVAAMLRGKTVALDMTNLVVKVVTGNLGATLDDTVDHFVALNRAFRDADTTALYVFDGPPQAAKRQEHQRRAAAAKASRQRVESKRQLLGIIETTLRDVDGPEGTRTLAGVAGGTKEDEALRTAADRFIPDDAELINVDELRRAVDIETRRQSAMQNRYQAIRAVKSVLLDMVPDGHCIDAPHEAEAWCSYLARQKLVDVVISDDFDCMVFGAPVVLTRYGSATPRLLLLEEALTQLAMTMEQFVEFCIMCGCDFAGRVKGVGPMKAYKLITTHGSLQAVCESMMEHDWKKLTRGMDLSDVESLLCAHGSVLKAAEHLTGKPCAYFSDWETAKDLFLHTVFEAARPLNEDAEKEPLTLNTAEMLRCALQTTDKE